MGVRGAELLQIGCQARTQRCTHLWERQPPFVQSSQGEGRGSLWGSLHSVLKVTLRRCYNCPFTEEETWVKVPQLSGGHILIPLLHHLHRPYQIETRQMGFSGRERSPKIQDAERREAASGVEKTF